MAMLRKAAAGAFGRYGAVAATAGQGSWPHASCGFSAAGMCTQALLEPQEQTTNNAKKKLGFSVLFLFLPCAATFGLGTWQLVRRQWKIDLLEHKRERLQEDPVCLVDALAGEGIKSSEELTQESLQDSLEYRKIFCEGVYDEEKSVFIGPRLKTLFGTSQKGYYIVTPLYPVPNPNDSPLFVQPPVLVNRGWVPASWREDFEKGAVSPPVVEVRPKQEKFNKGAWWKSWLKGPPSVQNIPETSDKSTVRVCGVVRSSENPNMFVPSNVPDMGQWFFVDVPAMAKATGLPENTPYIEAVEDGPTADGSTFPIPRDLEDFVRTSLMPQDHLNYAFTWYSLSAATTYMAVKRIQQKSPRKKIR